MPTLATYNMKHRNHTTGWNYIYVWVHALRCKLHWVQDEKTFLRAASKLSLLHNGSRCVCICFVLGSEVKLRWHRPKDQLCNLYPVSSVVGRHQSLQLIATTVSRWAILGNRGEQHSVSGLPNQGSWCHLYLQLGW